MATSTIPSLPAATSLNGTELLWAVQSGTDVRVTSGQIATLGFVSVTLSPLTVGTLPAATTGGQLCYVTDATSLTNGSIVAGTGTHHAIVKSDGTNWIVLG